MSKDFVSLKRKLLLPLLLIGLLFAVMAVWGIYAEFQRQLAERVRLRAEMVADSVNYAAEAVQPAVLQSIVTSIGAEQEVGLIVVVGGNPSRVLASTRSAWLGKPLSALPMKDVAVDIEKAIQTHQSHHHFHKDDSWFDLTEPLLVGQPDQAALKLANGAIMVHLDTRTIETTMRHLALKFSIAALVVLALLGLTGYLLVRYFVLNPVSEISKLLARHQKGDFGNWDEVASDDELGELAGTLNESLNRSDALIHKLKIREADLGESERRFRVLFEQAAVGAAQISTETGRFVRVNRKYCDLLGYSREEMERLDFQTITHPDDLVADLAEMELLKAGTTREFSMEKRYYRKDGSLIWVNLTVSPMWLPGEKPDYHIAVVEDISMRKQTEMAVRESEGKLRTLAELSPAGIYLTDPAGRCVYANPCWCEMAGLRMAEALGDGWMKGLHPEDRDKVVSAWEKLVASAGQWGLEYRFQTADGKVTWVYGLVNAHRDASGKTLGYVGVNADITERKRAEAELQRLNRAMRMISLLNQEIVHADNEKALLETGCRIAVEDGGYRMAWVGFAEQDEGKTVRPVASMGIGEDYVDTVNVTWADVERGRGPVGTAIRTNRPVVIRSTRTDPAFEPWRQAALQHGYASIIAMPLKDGEHCFGSLALYAGEVDAFDSAEEKLLVELANDFAYGIVTLRLRLERERMVRANHLQITALNSAANAILITNRDGRIEWGNPSLTRLTGYTLEESLGKNPRDLVRSGKQGSEFYKELWDTILAGRVWRDTLTNRRKDGSLYIEEETITPVLGEQGKITHFIAIKEDVTQRKRAEATLRLEGAALEAAANAIAITDRDGIIEWVNPAFTTTTGYSSAEVIGKTPRVLKSGKQDAAFYQNLWETILAGKVWHGEIINRRKNGSHYTEDLTITPLKDERGEITHFIAIKQDITQKKALEDQFRHSQKMQAVGVLAGGVAHEFNNLLGVIVGNASLLQMGVTSAEEQQHALNEIEHASQRAANLTRQLLAYGRKSMMQVKPLDLNDVVADAVKMLQHIIGEKIAMQTTLLSGGAPVEADAGMIEQVLMNLVINARDAMPQGGHLDISTQNILLGAHEVERHANAKPGSFIRLTVRDSGTGIAPEVLPFIFEPFFTTKDVGKGTGLGLSTVYGIMEQHRGWVEVESEPGKGAAFHVFLPRRAAKPKPAAGETVASPVRGGQETILLVEDDPSLRKILTHTIRRYGYTVIAAPSGTAALAVWPQHGAAVDLLLTDIVMPEDISGRQLVEQLLADKPSLKVVCMSGYPGEAADHGLDVRTGLIFLQKPFPPDKLAQAIRSCLDSQPVGKG